MNELSGSEFLSAELSLSQVLHHKNFNFNVSKGVNILYPVASTSNDNSMPSEEGGIEMLYPLDDAHSPAVVVNTI